LRYFNFWTLLEFPVFFPDTGNLSRYSTFLFFPFSLSFLRRGFHLLDSSLNAVILSILHLMLMGQFNPDLITHAFSSYSTNAALHFLERRFFSASRLLDAGPLHGTQPIVGGNACFMVRMATCNYVELSLYIYPLLLPFSLSLPLIISFLFFVSCS